MTKWQANVTKYLANILEPALVAPPPSCSKPNNQSPIKQSSYYSVYLAVTLSLTLGLIPTRGYFLFVVSTIKKILTTSRL